MKDTLRPADWTEYMGQPELKEELEIRVAAALDERRPLEPILLVAPPGAGKTSLAEIVARRLHEPLYKVVMPVKLTALVNIVRSFEGLLFLDELAEAPKSVQHSLLPLVELNFLQLPSGGRVEAGALSIIAATTDPQNVIAPLYDRFVVPTYDAYSDDDMAMIVLSMAEKARVDIDVDDALLFGAASCGIPRRARKFVVGYKALLKARRRIPTTDEVFRLLRTFPDGLTERHLDYLRALHALGPPKGLKPLADYLRLHENVVVDLERLLFTKGLIEYTDRGRCLCNAAYKRLKADERRVAA